MAEKPMDEFDALKREQVVLDLLEVFGSTLDRNIIESVAWNNNYDVETSSAILLDVLNNKNENDLKKRKVEDGIVPEASCDVNNFRALMANRPKKASPSEYSPQSPSSYNEKKNKSKKEINIEKIIDLIQQGFKVLVLLRGLPGSGKSHLARYIVDSTVQPPKYKDHILSTDDYFIKRNGIYDYDVHKIGDAHAWNQRRATQMLRRGVSPILIDNTNCELWEMKPYAVAAAECDYQIEIAEPYTHWAFNVNELFRRNSHNVPKQKIENMLLRYEKNVTPQKIKSAYNIRSTPPRVWRNTVGTESKATSNIYVPSCDGITLKPFGNCSSNVTNITWEDVKNVSTYGDKKWRNQKPKNFKTMKKENWNYINSLFEQKRDLKDVFTTNNSSPERVDSKNCEKHLQLTTFMSNEGAPNKQIQETNEDDSEEGILPYPSIESYFKFELDEETLRCWRSLQNISVEQQVENVTTTLEQSEVTSRSNTVNENQNLKTAEASSSNSSRKSSISNEASPSKGCPLPEENFLGSNLILKQNSNEDEDTITISSSSPAEGTENSTSRDEKCDLEEGSREPPLVHSTNLIQNVLLRQNSPVCEESHVSQKNSSQNLAAWGVDEEALVSWDVVIPTTSSGHISAVVNKKELEQEKVEVKPTTRDQDTSTEDAGYVRVITPRSYFIAGSSKRNLGPQAKVMLDKSSMTNEFNESLEVKQGFDELVMLFPNVHPEELREVYERCTYNVNWTAELLSDDNRKMYPASLDHEISVDSTSLGLNQPTQSIELEEPKPLVAPPDVDPEPSPQPVEEKLIDISGTSSKPKDNDPYGNLLNLEAWGLNQEVLSSWEIVVPTSSSDVSPQNITNNFDESNTVFQKYTLQTECQETQTESADFMVTNGRKVIIPRNTFIPADVKFDTKPKTKLTLDKSAMTEELMEIDSEEDKKFNELRSLFPNVPSEILRDIFEKCNYDTDWAAELLLEDKRELLPISVIPLVVQPKEKVLEKELEIEGTSHSENIMKKKPDNPFFLLSKSSSSDEVIAGSSNQGREQLKKVIEGKIKLSEESYSDHILKIKKQREEMYNMKSIPSTSRGVPDLRTSFQCFPVETDDWEDDRDFLEDSQNDREELVELNIGEMCANQLEAKFGDVNLNYPKGLQPVIQVPISLARQLHAFYLESIFQQIDAQNQVMEAILKEDEEFASKLQIEEYENGVKEVASSSGETEVPSLKAIMAEEAVLSRNRKDTEKWKDLTPEDLASKLTRQKLLDSFPNYDQHTLIELLHAYNNSYSDTVEAIMCSSEFGTTSDSNKIREPPITSQAVDEMKDAQEKCKQFTMATTSEQSAAEYREDANKILQLRTELYQKAQQYHQRGMRDVAMFYSNLAREQTKKYNYTNNLAAHVFLSEQGKQINDTETLDLHYLKIKEAITSLDICIDYKVEQLQNSNENFTNLYIITGRGKRSSDGKARLRPAVIARLEKRKIKYVFMNPGLLKVELYKNTKVTNDL